MSDVFGQLGIALLGSAIGALAAAYFAVRYATARLKRERGFDRRLEWYEGAIVALLEYRRALRKWSAAIRKGDDEQIRAEAAATFLARDEFLRLKDLARLYATTNGFTALSLIFDVYRVPKTQGLGEEFAQGLDELEALLRRVTVAVTVEARTKVLGLERLEVEHMLREGHKAKTFRSSSALRRFIVGDYEAPAEEDDEGPAEKDDEGPRN